MTIGKRIEMLRKEHNMSQRQLAEAIDISRKAVSRWEKGEVEPDNLQLVLIAKTLGVDIKNVILETDRAKDIGELEIIASTQADTESTLKPEVQIVERIVEKPVVEYVEMPVVKKVVRVKYRRNPIELAVVAVISLIVGLLIGIIIF